MNVGELCTRGVVCALPTITIADAAALMRQHHVGDVIVVDRKDLRPRPVGIVTDRDIVVEVVAKGLDCAGLTLGDLLTQPVQVIEDATSRDEVLRRMSELGSGGFRSSIPTEVSSASSASTIVPTWGSPSSYCRVESVARAPRRRHRPLRRSRA